MELRSVIACLALLFGSLSVKAQPASFYKVFSGNGYDMGQGVTQLVDSSYLITGSSSSFEEAPSQVFLLNIDKQGNFLWSKSYGGAEFEEGKRVFSVDGYGYFVVGTSSSGASHDFDAYALFTNPAGDLQWEQQYDNGRWERIHNAILLPDTTLILVGETDSTNSGSTDFFMLRIDKTGSLLWSKQWGTDGDDYINGIVAVSDTSFAVCGTQYLEDSLANKSYAAKFYDDGTMAWDTVFGTGGRCEMYDIQLNGGSLMLLGKQQPTGSAFIGGHYARVSLSGDVTYIENFTPTHNVYYTGAAQYTASPGKMFLAVQQEDPGIPTYPDGEDVFVYRYGSFYWDGYGVSYAGIGQDLSNQIIPTLDGYGIMVGYHSEYGYGGNSIFVVKIGDEYNFPYNSSNPIIYSLLDILESTKVIDCSAFPNPFRELVKVTLPEGILCSVQLLDQQGRILKKLDNQSNELVIDTADLPQGSYVLLVDAQSEGNAVIKLVK